MEANKENVRRHVKVTNEADIKLMAGFGGHEDLKSITRNPLETITGQCVNVDQPGPSRNKLLDIRCSTTKQSNESRCYYSIFEDGVQPDDFKASTVQKQVHKEKEETKKLVKPKEATLNETAASQRNLPDLIKKIGGNVHNDTPALFFSPPLQVSAPKKTKSSLKRPHSRGLLGLTSKLCTEKIITAQKRLSFSAEVEQDKKQFSGDSCMEGLNQMYTGDVMQYLLSAERRMGREPIINKTSRACVVNWIIKVNGSDMRDCSPATIETTCWLLNSYLGRACVPVNQLQLTAAACYWIATKLLGKPLASTRLVRLSAHAFTLKMLLSTEQIVLKKLEYSVQPAIPYDFVPYLSWWCDPRESLLVEKTAEFICQCGVMITKYLFKEYPSAIAVAAVKSALVLLGKESMIARLEASFVYKAVEKKAINLPGMYALLMRNIRTISLDAYEYKAPLIQYSAPPYFIVSRVFDALHEDSIRNTAV